MMPTERLIEELTKAKDTARTLHPSRAVDDLRRYIARIERRMHADG